MSAAALPWASLEGINGIGKTHLARQVAARIGPACHSLVELPDTPQASLPGRVIAALRADGDLFLRTGAPRTETLLLAALHVHRYEHLVAAPGAQLILEDRGPLTVALYQAAILLPGGDDDHVLDLANDILATIAAWRPPPTLTVLLRDDPARCLHRFEQRLGRPAHPSEKTLMSHVNRLYDHYASRHPERLTLIDRRHGGEHAVIEAITAACRNLIASHEMRPS
ncbi:thymidylate kinase [Nonomuraea sp. NPDC049695]|uniref:thymidylate kinase n=1 Tax=Nonomuraea sp. NPDC049695 TaxID=3154734 RepID=UPI0034159633